jgi:hypothetical protein
MLFDDVLLMPAKALRGLTTLQACSRCFDLFEKTLYVARSHSAVIGIALDDSQCIETQRVSMGSCQ